MSPKSAPFQGPRRRRPFLRWHRGLGIAAVCFVTFLAVTGILLNHNAALGLHQKQITHPWLLAHYDINSVPDNEFDYPETLTLDRVILDIHTGQFFGIVGRVVIDLVALAILLLSFTGIRLWLVRSRKPPTPQPPPTYGPTDPPTHRPTDPQTQDPRPKTQDPRPNPSETSKSNSL